MFNYLDFYNLGKLINATRELLETTEK